MNTNTTLNTNTSTMEKGINIASTMYVGMMFIFLFTELLNRSYTDLGLLISMVLAVFVSSYFQYGFIKSIITNARRIFIEPKQIFILATFSALVVISSIVFTAFHTALLAPVVYGLFLIMVELLEKIIKK